MATALLHAAGEVEASCDVWLGRSVGWTSVSHHLDQAAGGSKRSKQTAAALLYKWL